MEPRRIGLHGRPSADVLRALIVTVLVQVISGLSGSGRVYDRGFLELI